MIISSYQRILSVVEWRDGYLYSYQVPYEFYTFYTKIAMTQDATFVIGYVPGFAHHPAKLYLTRKSNEEGYYSTKTA